MYQLQSLFNTKQANVDFRDLEKWGVREWGHGGVTVQPHLLPGADKSLARRGRKQAAPVKSVMGRGMD